MVEKLYIEDYQHILSRGRGGQVKVICPFCHERRSNKRDRSLSINLSTLAYHCHYCDAKGYLKSKMEENISKEQRYFKPKKKEYKLPNQEINHSDYSKSFLDYFNNRGISETTLKRAKVSEESEFFPQLQKKSRCIAFNYYLLDQLINVKYRTRGKDFKLVSGAKLIPYNIDSISDESFEDSEEKYAIITEGECFDDKAQILTKDGWKLFSELKEGELVAQYENGNISFVKPLNRIIKQYDGNLVEFSNSRNNYYSLTTPNHNIIVEKNGKQYKMHANDISSQINITRNGFIDGCGLDLSDDQIRLYCALSADFTFREKGDIYGCFKKQRKYERIKMLLDNLQIRYSINIDSRGYYSVFIHRGHNIVGNKDFDMSWIGKLSAHQIDIILEEIVLWNGNSVKGKTMKEYNSNRMNNIIFIQTLCHLSNKCSTICKRSNEHGVWYKCTILQKRNSSTSSKYKKYIPYSGMVYCVTVPSGMIVVRQNDLITISGNCDALTYIECGLNHVVSVPNGASTNLEYLDDFIESHFDKLDYIYVSVDNDRKGVECRAELIRRLGKEKCRIIDYPSPCKDINEVLVQYGKNKVRECFKKYTELRIEGVDELIDVENELDYLFNNGLQRGTTVGIENIDNLISFQTGMLTVVTGVPSHGKTYYLNYLLSRLNILHNWKIAFFSPEFYPVNLHIAQIIETLGGNRFSNKNYSQQVYETMKDYVCKNFFWLDPDDTDITSVLERAKYLIKKKGIKAFVIDPFNALTDKEKKNVKQDEYISEFLQKIRWFARKYDVAIFLVMHPTKMIKLENGLYPVCDLYNCKGASEIFDKSDIGITVWRNEQDDYAEMHITKVKFRHLGEKGHTSFKFNINNGRFVSIGDASMLKQNGTDTRTMSVDWDNRNWIVDKINGVYSKQNTLELGNNNQYENPSFDDLMNEQVGEVPF